MLGGIFYSGGGEALAQLPRELWVPHPWRFKARLDGALGSLSWGGGSPAHGSRDWEINDL